MRDDATNRMKVLRGEALPQSKLTDDDVRLIRALVEERRQLTQQARSLSNARIAEKFGVHERSVEKIINGEQWGHVI